MSATRRERARRQRSRALELTISEWQVHYAADQHARGLRPGTVKTQRIVLNQLVKGVGDVDPTTVTVEKLEAWRDGLAQRGVRATTINQYLSVVGTFMHWLEREGVIDDSPAVYVDFLKEHDEAPRVLNADVRQRIRKGAAHDATKRGRSEFEAVRDQAVLAFLEDTGVRASECAGLLLVNVDLTSRQAYVHADIAKGGRDRTVIFGQQTARLLSKYLRLRAQHRFSFAPQLWLSRRGPLSYDALWALVKRAATRGGAIGIRPHLYRHTFAHEMKMAGASDEVLMSLAGWNTFYMLQRYGRQQRTERALERTGRWGPLSTVPHSHRRPHQRVLVHRSASTQSDHEVNVRRCLRWTPCPCWLY